MEYVNQGYCSTHFWLDLHGLRLCRTMFKISVGAYNKSGVHTITRITSSFKYLLNYKLMHAGVHRSGHNIHGHHNVYAQGHHSHTRTVSMLHVLKRFKYFLYMGWYYKKSLSAKIYSCCVNACGQYFYLPLTNHGSVLTLLPLDTFAWLIYAVPQPAVLRVRLFEMLCRINNFVNICYIAPSRGSLCTIAKACGSHATILSYRKVLSDKLVTARLPSGKLKYLYIYNTVLFGSILPTKYDSFKNTKAGYWRNLGKRPHVRGTAMNPVDHPHGGRCKAVHWPRTPWGLSAK